MELNNLYGFVLMLVLVAMILGVGILVIDKMSAAVYIDKSEINESITMPAGNASVQLIRVNLTKFISLKNTTGTTFASANYTVHLGNGTLTITGNSSKEGICPEGSTCYATYNWRDYGSAATVALNASRSAITPIASTWLTLIVTIVVLAIILTIVVRSFAQKGR